MSRRPHRVPAVTIKLGTVLDCTIAHGPQRAFVDEWKGFQLLSDEDAMDRARPRLYFVRGRLGADPGVEDLEGAARTYKRWTQRDPEHVGELDTRDARYLQGRMLRVGYRSDKWNRRGRTVDYDHDFLEDGGSAPLVYTDTKTIEAARTIIVLGGSMRVTEGGIA